MNNFSSNKYKRPRRKTIATTNPGTSRPRNGRLIDVKMTPEPLCPLLAKDSEWVEMQMQPSAETSLSASNVSDEEEVLQLVECEDGPQMKPLAIMFPDLIEKDPLTLQGVLNRVMSTTEVTRHLVELGQKANFTFMKKADRLIPRDKQWMESLTENSNSYSSVNSALVSNSILSSNEVNREITSNVQINTVKKKKKRSGNTNRSQQESSSRDLKEK